MPNFSNHILTEGGQALIAQAHLGRKLTFTKIAVGSGNQSNPIQATALATHQMDVGITSIQRDTTNANWVRVRGMFTNVSLTTAFNYREMGLFARIDSDPEVLYSYVADAGAGDVIPAYDGANPVIIYPTMIVIIESTIPIHADIVIGADFDCENIGPASVGPGVYSFRDGNTFKFKRLVEGRNIDLEEDSNTITIGQRVLNIDLDLYVPLSHPDAPNLDVAFPTIQAAFDHLMQYSIPADRYATINVAAGTYNITSTIVCDHPDAGQIQIVGATPFQRNATAAPGGIGDGGTFFDIYLADASGISVGTMIQIVGGAVAGMGGQEVSQILGNTLRVTKRMMGTGNTTSVASSDTTIAVRIRPTVLRASSVVLMRLFSGLRQLRNLTLVGAGVNSGLICVDFRSGLNVDDCIISDANYGLNGANAALSLGDVACTWCQTGIAVGASSSMSCVGRLYLNNNIRSGLLLQNGAAAGVGPNVGALAFGAYIAANTAGITVNTMATCKIDQCFIQHNGYGIQTYDGALCKFGDNTGSVIYVGLNVTTGLYAANRGSNLGRGTVTAFDPANGTLGNNQGFNQVSP